ncbi:MAG: hypothetical protein WEB00_05900 [Dehalococcoidia bacterium]
MADTIVEARDATKTGAQFAEHSTKAIEQVPLTGYWFGAIGSMVASAFLYLIGKKEASQFVGLWVPSIISLALFYKLLRPSTEVAEARRLTEQNGY